MARHLYAVHDWSPDWGRLVQDAGKTAWTVMTYGLGDDPDDRSGESLGNPQGYGVTPIVRLNYSHHGRGTIPLPGRYDAFAQRCANFVQATAEGRIWIVGNEPNLAVERPQGVAIAPHQYAECFAKVRQRIKQVQPQAEVLPAAVAPYNVDTGDWITYWGQMLDRIELLGGCDGFAVHTYSRGGGVGSITSNNKMNPPYQGYSNGFRAYQDFLDYIPRNLIHLPVYITETDQNVAWEDGNTGWVRAAYGEVDAWNKRYHPKIVCLALYRWYQHDQWEFQSKRGVVEDFVQTLTQTDYRVPALPAPGSTVHIPQVVKEEKMAQATVTAPSGANIRGGPGTNYLTLGAVAQGTVLPIRGRNTESSWWQVESTWGLGWVSGGIVSVANTASVPVAAVPASPLPVVQNVTREWMTVSWSRILGLDELVVRAILAIESGGRAFENGRMVIRFENHVFTDRVMVAAPHLLPAVRERFRYGTPPWTEHYWRLSGDAPWQKQHESGQAGEWQVFSFARTLHEEAAMLSISMGMGQIMGGNHRTVGYTAVQSMFNDYNHPSLGEYNQLTGFFAYVVNVPGMREAVQRKEWRSIARLYNGSGNEDYYAPILERKYRELGGR